MKCKHCDAEMEPDSRYCPACGMDSVEKAEAAPEAVAMDIRQGDGSEQPVDRLREAPKLSWNGEETHKTRRAKSGIAILLVICILGGIVLGVYAYTRRQGQPENETNLSDNGEIIPNPDADMTSVVAQMKDQALSNKDLSYYYWDMYYYAGYMFGNLLDLSVPLSEQQFSETESWHDIFLRLALENWVRIESLLELAEAESYEMDASYQENYDAVVAGIEQDAIDQGYVSADEFIRDNFGDFSDTQSYLDYLWDAYYTASYTDTRYNATLARIQAEPITEYEDTVNVRHVLIPMETEGAQTVAQGLYDQWLTTGTEESFAAMAEEHSTDPGSSTNGGLYENVTQGMMVDAFDGWIFDESRQPGDSDIVETNYGYHIMYYVGSGQPSAASAEALAQEEHNAWLGELVANAQPETHLENVLIGGNLFTRIEESPENAQD